MTREKLQAEDAKLERRERGELLDILHSIAPTGAVVQHAPSAPSTRIRRTAPHRVCAAGGTAHRPQIRAVPPAAAAQVPSVGAALAAAATGGAVGAAPRPARRRRCKPCSFFGFGSGARAD